MEDQISFPGTVHALGPEAIPAAEAYASLTARPYRTWDTSKSISASRHDVVVCTTDRLDSWLMHKLFVECDRGVPGVLCSRTASELEEVCRRQITMLSLPLRRSSARIFADSLESITELVRGADLVTGGLQEGDKLLEKLSLGAALLVVTGESMGFDISLTFRSFACAFLDSQLRTAADQLLPTCQVLGRCTRFPTLPLIAEARDRGWIVPISILRAAIGIFCSCSLVRVRDEVVDGGYSLGPMLLRYAKLGAVVTTWRPEPVRGMYLHDLINDLCTGTMVGDAIGSFNVSADARRYGVNLCLLGDPCFALTPNEAFSPLPVYQSEVSTSTKPPSTVAKDTTAADAQLLLSGIAHLLADSRFDPSKGQRLRRVLLPYAESTPLQVQRPDQSSAVDSALIDFLSGFPVPNVMFGPFSRVEGMTEKGVCPRCHAPARAYWSSFPEYGVRPRHIIACPSCLDCSNLPDGWNVELDMSEISDGVISVSGLTADVQVLVCFFFLETARLHMAVHWEPSPTGWLPFRLPEQLPPVPLYCQVLMARNLQIGTVGFKVKRAVCDNGASRETIYQSFLDSMLRDVKVQYSSPQ
jgi:hypothetical protein